VPDTLRNRVCCVNRVLRVVPTPTYICAIRIDPTKTCVHMRCLEIAEGKFAILVFFFFPEAIARDNEHARFLTNAHFISRCSVTVLRTLFVSVIGIALENEIQAETWMNVLLLPLFFFIHLIFYGLGKKEACLQHRLNSCTHRYTTRWKVLRGSFPRGIMHLSDSR